MENQFVLNNNTISYFDQGKGQVVLLLHGYLETKEVWESFSRRLSKSFRVISIDIPGHGKSNVIAKTHTMELMAQCIDALLIHLNIKKCTIVGHSMGGYIMLAFAKLYADKIEKIVVFHSSAYADTNKKKRTRLREIELIKKDKLELIVNTNLPNTFATDNLDRFSGIIEKMKKTACRNNPDGVCSLIRGMMERFDSQELISNFNKPMLFVFGTKDNYIPTEVGEKMISLNKQIDTLWLSNSGHMGFIEEEEKSIKYLKMFLFNTKK